MLSRHAPVTRIEPLPGNYYLLTVKSNEQACQGRPGQFFMLGLPRAGQSSDPLLNRPVSIMNIEPGSGEILFLVKQAGRGTRLLRTAAPGDGLLLHGPLGNGFPAVLEGTPLVLAGGGVGIAPLFFAASRANGHPLHVFYGGRTREDLPLLPFFRSLPLTSFDYTTEDGSLGSKGLVTAPLAEYLNREKSGVIYCCGPNRMMRAVTEMPASQSWEVLVSLENRMGCGMGVCLGCAVPVRQNGATAMIRVCKEGPVTAGRSVVWDALG